MRYMLRIPAYLHELLMDSQENVADQYDVSAKLISHLVVLSLDICMGVFSK